MPGHHVADEGVSGGPYPRPFVARGRCSCGMVIMAVSVDPRKARRKYNGRKKSHERHGKR